MYGQRSTTCDVPGKIESKSPEDERPGIHSQPAIWNDCPIYDDGHPYDTTAENGKQPPPRPRLLQDGTCDYSVLNTCLKARNRGRCRLAAGQATPTLNRGVFPTATTTTSLQLLQTAIIPPVHTVPLPLLLLLQYYHCFYYCRCCYC